MNNLITITAANNQRHFYINDANAKSILRYLKLISGDYSSNPDYYGGAICIWQTYAMSVACQGQKPTKAHYKLYTVQYILDSTLQKGASNNRLSRRCCP